MINSRKVISYQKLKEEIQDQIALDSFAKIPTLICEYIADFGQEALSVDNIIFLTTLPWMDEAARDSEDDYSLLGRKIKKYFPRELFCTLPDTLRDFLLNSREEELKDTQLMYLSKIPWNEDSYIDVPLADAKNILDKSHYGMETVKEKILRFIACQKHVGNTYGVVLLLVGPPGVGKTSIASTIAKAMGRKLEKISLAGISDALSLRGANSMYSDSKPGRVIEAVIHAQTRSAVILLDEIDKMGSSTEHGDPASVLLDILDSDRSSYIDGFLEVAVDLSKVIFIATANNLRDISPILQDRMEIIELPGYTLDERISIVIDYIWPNLVKKYMLKDLSSDEDLCFSIDKDALMYLIDTYTNEAGVRSLSQCCNSLCQAIISLYYTKGELIQNISLDNVNLLLSSIHYESQSNQLSKHRQTTKKRSKKPYKATNL